jgi:Mrp family chromosome partitioning ATPase
MTADDPLLMARLALNLRERLGRSPAVLLVSSVQAGDGKSLVANALAGALAEQREGAVGLVNLQAGLHAPGGKAGFADLLDQGSLPDGALRLDDRGVHCLNAGQPGSPASLFRAEAVARSVDWLRGRLALTLMDAPVLSACGALVGSVDQVLLVVDASRTTDHALQAAMQAARLAPERVAGVILNRRPAPLRWLRRR